MSISGTILRWDVITLEFDLNDTNEPALESYIRQKHKTAEENNRYVVRITYITDLTKEKDWKTVCLFMPKIIIDRDMIQKGTALMCGSDSCHIEVVGINDWFDRASNGATQIHDKRFK